MKSLMARIAPAVLVIAFIVLVWDASVRVFAIQPFLVPSPMAVVEVVSQRHTMLISACGHTAMTASLGLLIACVVGVTGGAIIASSTLLFRGVYPIASFLQTVPLIAVAPLLVSWLGYGSPPTTAAAALVALFPVVANTIDGLRGVDPAWKEVFTLHHASRWQRWRKLELPAAMPQIVTGVRIATGLSVIGSIVGEFVSGYAGDRAPIGMVIVSAMRESRTDVVFAAIALSSLVGLALFSIVSMAGAWLLRGWHPAGRA